MAIMEHVNGRGRIVPALPQHTFKDSGITIGIRKVGPSTHQGLALAILKDMPEPPIPIVETELGAEPNAADPAYIAAREKWNQDTRAELTRRLMLIAALEAEVTIDGAAKADIVRKKRSMELADTPWMPDPRRTQEEDDRVFYILHIAASTAEDITEFGDVVLRRSVPTEEAVQTQIATFRSEL